jgi:Tfp pilus assembly protein PilF
VKTQKAHKQAEASRSRISGKRLCELLPQSAVAFHKTGLFLVKQNEMTVASAQFRQALALRPDYAPALNELGMILANQQKTAEAEEYFQKAIQLNPSYVETYLNVGFLRQNAGKCPRPLLNIRWPRSFSRGARRLFRQSREPGQPGPLG